MKKVMSASVDELVIKMGMDAAHELRISFSSLVEEAIRDRVNSIVKKELCEYCKKVHDPRIDCRSTIAQKKTAADRIREKESLRRTVEQVSGLDLPGKTTEDLEDESDAKIIAEGQAKLDKERKKQNIKTDKIKPDKNKVESLTGHSGPVPKGKK